MAQVLGLMDKAGDKGGRPEYTTEDSSSHDEAMKRFEKAGYEVRYQRVNPLHLGVPQSRPRIHYQGISKWQYPLMDVKAVMDELKVTWSQLTKAMGGQDASLSDYLLLPDELPTQPSTPASEEPSDLKRSKRQFKWETVHADFKKEHQAGTRNRTA